MRKHIRKHVQRLSRLDDGQIFWTDECVSPLEELYKRDRDHYINALDNIMCDVDSDHYTRMAAFNLYNLVWFMEEDKGNITQHIRDSIGRVILEDDGITRREILCSMRRFCSGSNDALLHTAYNTSRHYDSTFRVMSDILRDMKLTEDIPESSDMLYVNMAYGINSEESFDEKYERMRNMHGDDIKRFLLERYTNVVGNGDVYLATNILKHLFNSPYSLKVNKSNMMSYLQQVPEIWNELSEYMQK